jgi:hypothetical protein
MGLPSKKRTDGQQMLPCQWKVKGENGMMGKMIIGLIGAALLFLVLAMPIAAAEKTFQFAIPGCAT